MPNVSSRFFAAAARNKTAIACGDAQLSYPDLAAQIARLSQGLAKAGVKPGDAIAAMGPNDIAFVTVMMAAADLGAMLVPLPEALPTSAVQKALHASEARHLIAPQRKLDTLLDAGVDVTGLTCAIDAPNGLEALIAAEPADASNLGWGRIDDAYILTMTSGSTGDPKPIVLTQESKLERAGAAVRLYDITQDDHILAATPLYHSLAERLVLIPLLIGAQSVLMPRYSPDLWIDTVEAQNVTFTIAVSSQLAAIARKLADAGQTRTRCASLRCVVSSSATLAQDDKARILETLPGALHECYGASEIAIATSVDVSNGDEPAGSVGRAAPGVDVKILDDDGAEAPIGEIGEIACRTPMVFGGYFNQPDATAASMADGYFKTGDLGRLDADGHLFFQGRKKDLIITGGVNVYPGDIEAVVGELPGVAACAAFAWPDDRLGECVAVALLLDDGAAVSARDVRRWCLDKLADYQTPQRIAFLDALPTNAMGKLMRGELYDACAGDTSDGRQAA